MLVTVRLNKDQVLELNIRRKSEWDIRKKKLLGETEKENRPLKGKKMKQSMDVIKG